MAIVPGKAAPPQITCRLMLSGPGGLLHLCWAPPSFDGMSVYNRSLPRVAIYGIIPFLTSLISFSFHPKFLNTLTHSYFIIKTKT